MESNTEETDERNSLPPSVPREIELPLEDNRELPVDTAQQVAGQLQAKGESDHITSTQHHACELVTDCVDALNVLAQRVADGVQSLITQAWESASDTYNLILGKFPEHHEHMVNAAIDINQGTMPR